MTNIGLIGFGQWARQAYAPLLGEMPQVHVVAVSARSHTTRESSKTDIWRGDEDIFGLPRPVERFNH